MKHILQLEFSSKQELLAFLQTGQFPQGNTAVQQVSNLTPAPVIGQPVQMPAPMPVAAQQTAPAPMMNPAFGQAPAPMMNPAFGQAPMQQPQVMQQPAPQQFAPQQFAPQPVAQQPQVMQQPANSPLMQAIMDKAMALSNAGKAPQIEQILTNMGITKIKDTPVELQQNLLDMLGQL